LANPILLIPKHGLKKELVLSELSINRNYPPIRCIGTAPVLNIGASSPSHHEFDEGYNLEEIQCTLTLSTFIV